MNLLHLIWICPVCAFAGMLIAALVGGVRYVIASPYGLRRRDSFFSIILQHFLKELGKSNGLQVFIDLLGYLAGQPKCAAQYAINSGFFRNKRRICKYIKNYPLTSYIKVIVFS